MESARKDVGASICRSRVQPVLQRGASLLRDFELNRTAGLALDDCRPVSHVSADCDVIDPKADEIAAPKLAVDGEVEHGQIAFVVLDLKSDANGQTSFGRRGRFFRRDGLCSTAHARDCFSNCFRWAWSNLHARPLHRIPPSEGRSL
jgi:hypothetical protein